MSALIVPNVGLCGELLKQGVELSDEQWQRLFAIERVSIVCRCTLEAAQSWLDRDDAEAIKWARKKMNGTPQIDLEDEIQ
jgi:hypothetical protein